MVDISQNLSKMNNLMPFSPVRKPGYRADMDTKRLIGSSYSRKDMTSQHTLQTIEMLNKTKYGINIKQNELLRTIFTSSLALLWELL